MAIIVLPDLLASHTGGQACIDAIGRTVQELLFNLTNRYPLLQNYVLSTDHQLNDFMAYYLNDSQDVRTLSGMDTPVAPGDTLTLVPAMAGG